MSGVVDGLRRGADDYVTKPFSPTELVLRVQAVLHRTQGTGGVAEAATFGSGRLRIDDPRHEAHFDGAELELTPTEWGLLTALVATGYVTRRLTGPLQALTGAARRFAAGEAGARAATGGPGELGELGELATALDTMADDVVRADQVRRSFAADVAHELRTPLAALQAGLEELRDGLRAADTERLAALHDQTLRLGRVAQDLADLSAAESAALSLHRTSASR